MVVELDFEHNSDETHYLLRQATRRVWRLRFPAGVDPEALQGVGPGSRISVDVLATDAALAAAAAAAAHTPPAGGPVAARRLAAAGIELPQLANRARYHGRQGQEGPQAQGSAAGGQQQQPLHRQLPRRLQQAAGAPPEALLEEEEAVAWAAAGSPPDAEHAGQGAAGGAPPEAPPEAASSSPPDAPNPPAAAQAAGHLDVVRIRRVAAPSPSPSPSPLPSPSPRPRSGISARAASLTTGVLASSLNTYVPTYNTDRLLMDDVSAIIFIVDQCRRGPATTRAVSTLMVPSP